MEQKTFSVKYKNTFGYSDISLEDAWWDAYRKEENGENGDKEENEEN